MLVRNEASWSDNIYSVYQVSAVKMSQNTLTFPSRSPALFAVCKQLCLLCLSVLLLQSCLISTPVAQPDKGRLHVALIIPPERATLAMHLYENYRELRRRIQLLHGRPRIKIHIIPWQEFFYNNSHERYDAMIYIALYSQVPSEFASGITLEELLELPLFLHYNQPRRFIWFLFEENSELDRYRLSYPDSPYVSSNTGPAALRKIFELSLYEFLRHLQELYY